MREACVLILVFTVSLIGTGQSSTKTLVIAHRGASAHAPENTLAAFRMAVEMQADALELDVRQSKDGRLVVLHDASVNRTTNGKGRVSDFTLEQLQRLDAGSWFDERFRGERIPTLEEVITLLDSTTLLIIEIKGDSSLYPDIERRVVEAVRNAGIERQTILKSFEPGVIERFKRLAPEIPRLYVYAFRIPWLGLIIDTGISTGSVFDIDAEYLQPHWLLLSHSFTRTARARGFKIIAWGVNNETDMRKAIEFGVNGIETGYPGVLRRILNESR